MNELSSSSFRESAVSRLSHLHKGIRDGDYASMKEELEANPSLLLEPNSVGWTSLHLCCSQTCIPVDMWKWVLEQVPADACILELRQDVGYNPVTQFFRSYLDPHEWQRHEVRQAAKDLRLLIMYLLESDEMTAFLRERLDDDSNEQQEAVFSPDRDFTPVLNFWKRMELLLATISSNDDPVLHSLSRTSCPSEVSLLALKLYPHQLRLYNAEGALPLHLACRHLDAQEILKVLVTPDTVILPELSSGRLPLHIALTDGGKCISRGIRSLWRAWPDFGSALDTQSGMPAFLLQPNERVVQLEALKLAKGDSLLRFMSQKSQQRAISDARNRVDTEYLETVYELLREAPHAIQWCIDHISSTSGSNEDSSSTIAQKEC